MGSTPKEDLWAAISAFHYSDEGDYDIVTNNCGVALIELVGYLGLDLNSTAIRWIAQALEKGGVISPMVRENKNIGLLFPNLSTADISKKSDNELTLRLTEYTVATVQARVGSPSSSTTLPIVPVFSLCLMWIAYNMGI
eukprot:TRINITY_DN7379_c0_g1_i4.p1 TRINITY_DN7379_c0_g1~~TRINITY_DN7379_c0_g1_i4.p1  ORF type:complete len:139 (+),score=23.10 TRINITY_DN7379_c0_g1_i4:131-547(+)